MPDTPLPKSETKQMEAIKSILKTRLITARSSKSVDFLPVSAPKTHLRDRYPFGDSNLQSIVNASMGLIATNFSLPL